MLWTPQPQIWDATAPILFPVCGWTRDGRVRVNGTTYPLGLHGFARFEAFDIALRGDDFVRFVLRDNSRTHALYPFAFELAIEYRLAENGLRVSTRVRNTGDRPMPYAFGLHPGFRWPLAGGCKQDYAILFDRAERPEVPIIAPGGLFSTQRRALRFSNARTLPLSDETFAQEALCFLNIESDGLDLVGPRGRALRVEWTNMAHVVLWSRANAPFLCIETWTGHGDPEGFSGDLYQKPSMTTLAPEEESHHSVGYVLGTM